MNSMAAALAVGLMVAACTVSATSGGKVAAEDCSSALTDLLDCLSYVTDGSNTSSPSAGCCIGVADVVIDSPACICDVLKQARELGVTLNTGRVLGLPAACAVKAPEIHCPGEIPPASSPSPSTAPSPAPYSSAAPSWPPPSPISAPTLTPTSSPPAAPPPAPSTESEAPSPSPADAPPSDEQSSSDAPQLFASLLLLFAVFAVTSAFN